MHSAELLDRLLVAIDGAPLDLYWQIAEVSPVLRDLAAALTQSAQMHPRIQLRGFPQPRIAAALGVQHGGSAPSGGDNEDAS